MRWMLPIVLAGLAFSPVQAAPFQPQGAITQQTAGDFVKDCARDGSRCGLTVGSALLDKIDVVSGPAQICLPTGAQLGDAVSAWLRARPEMAGQPAQDAIFAALVALYPCAAAKTQLAAQ